jgi:hypothetical protein
MQHDRGEVCLPKSRVSICFQRRLTTSGPSTHGRPSSPTAREMKQSCQFVCETSHPTISVHRSTSEAWNQRYSPNMPYSNRPTSTIASARYSHDQRYSEERRTCAMIRLSRPREIDTVKRGDLKYPAPLSTRPFLLHKQINTLECPTREHGSFIESGSTL